MYAVNADVGALWRQLLLRLSAGAGTQLEVIDHAAPAPLADLWRREDKGAVFMCGLPFAQSRFAAQIIAAPVPAPPEFASQPRYWSDFVVREDSGLDRIEDTFGRRIAFTVADSQSGYAAPLNFLRAFARNSPLYAEIVSPRLTPTGALHAVVDGAADVAPIDSYALALLERHCPALTAQVRTVARTEPTPIPPLISSPGLGADLQDSFLNAHQRQDLRALLQALRLERFVRPEPTDYEPLRVVFERSLSFWRHRPLASIVHPAFL